MENDEVVVEVPLESLHQAHRLASDIVGVVLRGMSGDMTAKEAFAVLGRRGTKLVSLLADLEMPAGGAK